MLLNVLSKIKLHPGIQISWLHCAQGIILMQILQQPGLVVLFQSEPGPTGTTTRAWRRARSQISAPLRSRGGQETRCSARPDPVLEPRVTSQRHRGTAGLRVLCSTTRCRQRSRPTSRPACVTGSLSPSWGRTWPRSSPGGIPSGEQRWFELHSSLCCRRLICSN